MTQRSIENIQNIENNNFHHLVWDVAWFGVAWVTITRFLSVYAIRVGASPAELGWITAGPPLAMLCASFFTVWWRSRFPDPVRAIFLPTLLFRFNLLLLAFTPLLPTQFQPLWIILAVTLPSFPQGISNILFMSLLKETTPNDRMTPLLGKRALVVNLSLGLGALIFGRWLEHMPYPYNYASIFGFGFLMALGSVWHVMKVKVLDPDAVRPTPVKGNAQVNPLADRDFRRVIILAVVGHVAFFSVFPMIPLHLVNGLGASEGYMGIYSVIELSGGALVALFLARIVRRIGNRRMVAVAMIGTAASSLVVALTPNLPLALIGAVLTGAGWSTSEIGLLGYFNDNTPTRNATFYTRIYGQAVWISVFIAPFIGALLAELNIPLPAVLLVGTALRLIASGIILNGLYGQPARIQAVGQAAGD